MWITLLGVGFLLGLKHALDADHLSAVTSLAARSASLRETARIAGAWGLGHAASLVAFGSVLVLLGTRLPPEVALVLEAAVGVMLVVLGAGVLVRARRRRIHMHVHDHGDAVRHVHLHAHQHDRARHDHAHVPGLAPRALLVGCVHGLAGTAGLVLLAVPTMGSGSRALLYLLVFGLGTIIGMIGFSLLISIPLSYTARALRRATFALDALLGLANVGLGVAIAFESLSAILAR